MTLLVLSPLANPAVWALSLTGRLNLPPGLRYSGYGLRALRATTGTAAEVRAPASGIVRTAPGSGAHAGKVFVELQVNPLLLRRIASGISGGAPTFYFVLDPATVAGFTAGDTVGAGERLATASEVVILLAGQDRTAVDPALWAQRITAALTAANADATSWQPFATQLTNQTNTGPAAPILVLDHAGALAGNAPLDLVFGPPGAETVHRVAMQLGDGGDLQKTVARLNAQGSLPIPNLWGSASSVRLRPVRANSPLATPPLSAMQLARVEDGAGQAGEIELTPANRHVALTDLDEWLAPQFVASSPLARFTRGNRLRTFVNGPDYYRDLFTTLPGAASAGGELHLAGWSIVPDLQLTQRLPTDPATLPVTLETAAKAISDAGGRCRFLPSQLIRLDPNAPAKTGEFWVFFLIIVGVLVIGSYGIVFITDGSGAFILFGLIVANPFVMSLLFDSGGRPLEQNAAALDALETAKIAGSSAHFSPYPATLDDNTAAPPRIGFPFDALVGTVRGYGVHHQKLAVVKSVDAAGSVSYVGYCGGIDPWPDRLDDERHLAADPFHDVHSRVDGPAVLDLAQSFKERWEYDVPAEPIGPLPARAAFGSPGRMVVQVGRTYFAAADPARAFPFAPNGDRTIGDTILRAIRQAREFIYIEDQYLTPPAGYQSALLSKVASGDIGTLVITIPGLADQPFGEIVRDPFVAALRAADAGRGIVRVGYPRLHGTVPENELRAASGRCLLMEDLSATAGLNPIIALGPITRLPRAPFWVAVEGELMYVYDEAAGGDATRRLFKVDRGDSTRLLRGGSAPKGGATRAHSALAAATVIDFRAVYVHAKMMIVDDVFLSVGSANLNRRGLYHDSEINVFAVPEALRHDPANPVSRLRRQLWAEMLDLPRDLAGPLLEDPRAAAPLFDRSLLAGNRYTPIDAFPAHLMFGATTGDGLVGTVLQLGVSSVVSIDHRKLFDALVDPSSATENAP